MYRLKSPLFVYMSVLVCVYVFACKRSVSFEMISVETNTTDGLLGALSV